MPPGHWKTPLGGFYSSNGLDSASSPLSMKIEKGLKNKQKKNLNEREKYKKLYLPCSDRELQNARYHSLNTTQSRRRSNLGRLQRREIGCYD